MVRWVVGSMLHGGPFELFLVPASAPQLVYQRPWYVLSFLWDGAYIKQPLLLIGKSSHVVVAAGFLSRYLNGSLPYVPRNITVNFKMC